jgi:hypothetical protein
MTEPAHFPVPRPARASLLVCLPPSWPPARPGRRALVRTQSHRSHPFLLFAFAATLTAPPQPAPVALVEGDPTRAPR